MTWSEFTKKVGEFFKGGKKEKQDVDTGPYKEQEAKLNGELKKISDEFAASYDPGKGYEDISDLLPEEIDFVYRRYDGDDIQTIKDKTASKYQKLKEDDGNVLKTQYGGKVDEIESKKNAEKQNQKLQSQKIDDKYKEFDKALREDLVRKGLYRSSIKEVREEDARQSKESDLEKLGGEVSSKISLLDAQIDKLRAEEKAALGNLDLSYAKKLDSEINSLLDKRNKQIEAIDKYNNSLREKELKYKEDRASAIEKQLAQRIKDELEIKRMEEQVGYAGEKGENYDKRYDLAMQFYKGLPREAALKMIGENKDLQEYLGLYYSRLLREIGKKG